MNTWTSTQWTGFTLLTVAGLAALALITLAIRAVRGWTAPALYLAPAAPTRPRPSIALAAERATLPPLLPLSPAELVAVQELTAPGAGSIVSTLEQEGVYGPREDTVDPDLAELFGTWEDGWRRALNARLAPAMLTAMRWAIEGTIAGVDGAAVLLAERIISPTGEYPIVLPTTRQVRGMAEALLAS